MLEVGMAAGGQNACTGSRGPRAEGHGMYRRTNARASNSRLSGSVVYLWRTLGYVPKVVPRNSRGKRMLAESNHAESAP